MAGNESYFDVVKLMVNIRLKSINGNARDMAIRHPTKDSYSWTSL